MLEIDTIIHDDCMKFLNSLRGGGGIFDLTLTDIPYGEVNRSSNGLRNLNKKAADVMTFDLPTFLEELYRVTKSTIIIFCGKEQLSEIHGFFAGKQMKGLGTVRQLIWNKSNPSPMNGQHIYLSGVENAVWFKKRGGTFNAKCKNTVFKYPNGRAKLHPTEKNHDLIRELIRDNSNEGDLIFDPCCGSGAHCLVAAEENRHYIGIELNDDYYKIASERLENYKGETDGKR